YPDVRSHVRAPNPVRVPRLKFKEDSQKAAHPPQRRWRLRYDAPAYTTESSSGGPMSRAKIACASVGLLIIPSLVYAQGSISGIVRDASGAVLPGVNIEASSPALIEKVRSVTTNDSGQYRIENL